MQTWSANPAHVDKKKRENKFVTIKFLKIRAPEKFAVIILKFEQRGFTTEKWVQKT